jgi:hypothetical protein
MTSLAILQANSSLPQRALMTPDITTVHLSSKNNNPSKEESIPLNTKMTPVQELQPEDEGLLATAAVATQCRSRNPRIYPMFALQMSQICNFSPSEFYDCLINRPLE